MLFMYICYDAVYSTGGTADLLQIQRHWCLNTSIMTMERFLILWYSRRMAEKLFVLCYAVHKNLIMLCG